MVVPDVPCVGEAVSLYLASCLTCLCGQGNASEDRDGWYCIQTTAMGTEEIEEIET